MSTLLALHGFSQTGARFRADLEPLLARLPARVSLLFPDAAHDCSAQSVDRLYALAPRARRPAPPHRCWWDASDDGRSYRGWQESVALLRGIAERHTGSGPLGVLGFSQGAIAATALAGLAAHERFPRIDYVVLVAGRAPRCDDLRDLFESPLALPSLHVWGEKDPFAMGASARVLELYDARQRDTAIWAGPHVVPTRGAPSDAIVSFIERFG
jgi:hypothetical protein